MSFSSFSIGGLRIISIIEALSYIYLLYCSIYLKRMQGIDDAIQTPGMVHGVLFCIYVVFLALAMFAAKWSVKQGFLLLLASLFPIIPFFVEPWFRKEQLRLNNSAA